MDDFYRQLSVDTLQDGEGDVSKVAAPPNKRTEVPATNSTPADNSLQTTASDKPSYQSERADAYANPVKKRAAARAEVLARIVAARRSGPDRPLLSLVQREAHLHAHEDALAKLSNCAEVWPDKNLLNSSAGQHGWYERYEQSNRVKDGGRCDPVVFSSST